MNGNAPTRSAAHRAPDGSFHNPWPDSEPRNVLAALGVIGLAVAVLCWPARWGLRSFAVTLGILALSEIGIGVGLYLRTGPQVSGLLALLLERL
ncbi:MAG: hypothetical protein ACREMC_03280 [Gemmatimonadales bacterium]